MDRKNVFVKIARQAGKTETATALHLLLPGEAFWVLQDRLNPRVGGAPTRFDIVLLHLMRPRLDDRNDLKDYVFGSSSRRPRTSRSPSSGSAVAVAPTAL